MFGMSHASTLALTMQIVRADTTVGLAERDIVTGRELR